MIYDHPVDVTYVIPKHNEDVEEDNMDDEEEAETTKSGYNLMWIRCV